MSIHLRGYNYIKRKVVAFLFVFLLFLTIVVSIETPAAGMPGALRPIAAGAAHSLAIRNDRTLWAWGSNGSGRLGDGTTTNRLNPVQVLTNVVSVSAGDAHVGD